MKPKFIIPSVIIGLIAIAAIAIITSITTQKPQPASADDVLHPGKACCSTGTCTLEKDAKMCCPMHGGKIGEMTAGAENAMASLKPLDFTLKNQDGEPVTLTDFAGKIIVLEWINHECPFVVPHLEKGTMANLANKYADKGVVWLGVNSTSHVPAEADKQMKDEYNLPYPILNDRDGKVGHLFGATNTPHIFILDTAGKVVYQGPVDNAHRGITPDNYIPYVDNVLAKLTSGETVTPQTIKPVGCTVKYAK